jgi:hypothetical protein
VIERWTNWRSFRDAQHGAYLEAPIGLGVYEIRRASDRASVKLACTNNIADALSAFCRGRKGLWRFLFRRATAYAPAELEYRFWSHRTISNAKETLQDIRQQRGMVSPLWAWREDGRGI